MYINMKIKELNKLLNDWFDMFETAPSNGTRSLEMDWIKSVVKTGENIYKHLSSIEYIHLCENVGKFKKLYRPSAIKKRLEDVKDEGRK